MEFGPAIQRTRLARSYKSIQMNEEKTIHPERMVMRTIRNITGSFLYGINRPEDGYLRAYDYCVQWAQRDSQTKEIFGPSFKWTVEKFNLRFVMVCVSTISSKDFHRSQLALLQMCPKWSGSKLAVHKSRRCRRKFAGLEKVSASGIEGLETVKHRTLCVQMEVQWHSGCG